MDVTPYAVSSSSLGQPDAPAPPKRVRIAGDIADVRFPAECARCTAPPAGALAVTKMFRRVPSESPAYHVYATVRVPFCRDCLAAHERERVPPDPRVLRKLRNRWLVRCLPYVIPIAVILYMIGQFVPAALRGLAGGNLTSAMIYPGVVIFFGVLLLMFVRLVLAARRDLVADYDGYPHGQYVEFVRGPLGITCVIPGPPTSTLAAVDFGDEESELFEPDKRSFRFTNHVVREHFAELNAELVWRKNSPRARRARLARRVLLVVLAAVGAAFLVADYFGYLGG
jgi:hypothetical protein